MLNIKEAKEELTNKSYKDIQTETAYKWSSRAIACYEFQMETSNKKEKLMWWTLGVEYQAEGIEHAALTEDNAILIAKLEKELIDYHKKAQKDIEKLFD